AGGADGPGEPGEAVVAGALQGEGDLAARQGAELREAERARAIDEAGDVEPPVRLADDLHPVVRDGEELLVGRELGAQFLPHEHLPGDPARGLRYRIRLIEPGDDLVPGRDRG